MAIMTYSRGNVRNQDEKRLLTMSVLPPRVSRHGGPRQGAWVVFETLTQDDALDLFSYGKVPQKFAGLEGEGLITILAQTRSGNIGQRKGPFERRIAGTSQDQSISAEDRLDGCDECLGCHFRKCNRGQSGGERWKDGEELGNLHTSVTSHCVANRDCVGNPMLSLRIVVC